MIEVVCWQQTEDDGGEGAVGKQAESADQNIGNQDWQADEIT